MNDLIAKYMHIDELDIEDLRSGQPPLNPELLTKMTLGRKLWLERVRDYYLVNYIANGGSKVKVLVGNEGSGKTHLLRCTLQDAETLGYETVYLSARDCDDYRLNNLPRLYRAITGQIDKERLVRGLCCCVARQLGYTVDKYDGTDFFLPVYIEDAELPRDEAIREIKKAAGKVFRHIDFGPSFRAFAYRIVNDRMIRGNEKDIKLALEWLSGEKLARRERNDLLLFEQLQKTNARYWLNSLIRLLKIAGMTGLVVAIDDLEVITERSNETGRFIYTINAIKDTCELFRQLIDDAELLNGFLLLLAGRRETIEDEKRGFISYDALWMRLQTGLVQKKFNPLADMVDTDAHLAVNGSDFPSRVQTHLRQILSEMGLELQYQGFPDLSEYSDLRARVIEVGMMIPKVG
ncbi:hypothetical protein C7Y66_10865 [Chroococcidiopsis sp. CCALA 051]|uniref:BREX system ATP-binding domain-containing protein n=1 Tax=Chroococcidiopsis sp. CCALA 051 TaxID=869949 RepID=UPI000D0CD6ED|nr:BREX system ATP-binding domain-containing protein [Chroococcidiopsis sp. CCALA 051]MBE9019823.1 DUF2791 family P-loop domain-containing protein [Chroococcidiopsidales cyanobacterium LEGE 13417]PSM49118.1 hypothetical protein C7Y66_10865 [Chroococcidiopsis sp. CCALA 051]